MDGAEQSIDRIGLSNSGLQSSAFSVSVPVLTLQSNDDLAVKKGRSSGQQEFHYVVPNLTSVLYDYTNKEQDIVKQAFRVGNFQGLRDLPDDVAPFTVTHAQRIKVQDANLNSQITSQNSKIYRELLKENGGVFQKFEHIPDPFGAEKAIRRREQAIENDKIIAGPFNPAKLQKRLAYEYPFLGMHERHTYSFLSQDDPYSVSTDDRLRAKWIEEAKQLYGSFVPAGPKKPIHQVSKSLMKEIVDCIKKLLLSDWNDVNFVLGSKCLLLCDPGSEPQRLHRGEVRRGHRGQPGGPALLHEHHAQHQRRRDPLPAAQNRLLLGLPRGQLRLLHVCAPVAEGLHRKCPSP